VWTSEVKQPSGQMAPSVTFDPQFAQALNLLRGQKLRVRGCAERADLCSVAHVSPTDPSGWEIIELNPVLLEQQMLNQVRIVWQGLTFPVWISGAQVLLTVDRVEPYRAASAASGDVGGSGRISGGCAGPIGEKSVGTHEESAGGDADAKVVVPQCLLMAVGAEVVVAPRVRAPKAEEAVSAETLPAGVTLAPSRVRVLPSTSYTCGSFGACAASMLARARPTYVPVPLFFHIGSAFSVYRVHNRVLVAVRVRVRYAWWAGGGANSACILPATSGVGRRMRPARVPPFLPIRNLFPQYYDRF
jgi:hypothetical protein